MDAGLRQSDPDLLSAHLGRAAAASGLPLEQLCAEGPAAELVRTEVAQPAIFAVSLALSDIARAVGLRPTALAGHSLVEYTAAVAAGALTPEHGASLVAERGRLMAGAQHRRSGAMAAILGPTPATVERLCERVAGSDVLGLANFNAPTQTVVSGDAAAVDRLLGLVRELAIGRAVRLPVGATFHSPLMEPVQKTLVAEGCRHFLELGPGRVLKGLVGQIAPDADVVSADSRAAIEAYAAARPHLLMP